jgi:hypothetical protein
MTTPMPPDQMSAEALVILARANIPPDIQELLVRGDPLRGIAPNAIGKALAAARREENEACQKIAEKFHEDGLFTGLILRDAIRARVK